MQKWEEQSPLARSTVMWMTKSTAAMNQNFGAMITISTRATAKWIRQWTKSGSAQPFFWSLPWAIQAVCRTKSAMMCLTVKSSIQPTSRPTGTDDDMAGSDKLTTSRETWDRTRGGGVQRNSFSKQANSTPY